jgi:hypothetical protein
MTRIRRVCRTVHPAYVLMALVALANGGCILVAAGAAAGGGAVGYAYWQGRDSQDYHASLGDTWAATQTALHELGMTVERQEQTTASGFLLSHTTDGESVKIHLDAVDNPNPGQGPLTHVSVRVANFGDHPVGTRVLYQIGAHLAPPGLARVQPQPALTPPPPPALGPVQPAGWSAVPAQTGEPPLAHH